MTNVPFGQIKSMEKPQKFIGRVVVRVATAKLEPIKAMLESGFGELATHKQSVTGARETSRVGWRIEIETMEIIWRCVIAANFLMICGGSERWQS